MKIYNTLGRKLEEFKTLEQNKVSFYHCGPTVYWTQHIGNLRGMTMGDLIRRSLIYMGNDVKYVRNYTDFGHLTSDSDEGEDKMEKGAKREGISPKEIADKYIKIFETDTNLLNILEPSVTARATDYIDEMIKMVEELLEKGYAYSTPKAIYFDISKFPNYTELSGRDLEKDKEGAGAGDVSDDNKKNSADFAVWFFRTGPHKNALQYWPSPFTSTEVENGNGFPGWHLECSAMIRAELGKSIDLHMGGVEHISIHHPNEIAQSEAANGEKFVNFWLHNEHLLYESEKMSKSLGNVYNLEHILERNYDPMHLRYFYLQAQYRSKQNFTWNALDAAKTAYEKLISNMKDWQSSTTTDKISGLVSQEYKLKFTQSLESDFNIPGALAVLWELVKSDLDNGTKLATIIDFDRVLGLKIEEHMNQNSTIEVSPEVQLLLDKRQEARDKKDWKLSDEIRDELANKFGLKVKDSKDGQTLEKI